ncbi:hypothetical protein Dsin_009832 [Dipteronia sinensis]|uniref:Uncharacterized protein n=1 Tax=Dipteronia sinensis TaxID=43782 RepID=A0AAE0ASJ9_9ROSI|nr:hypothetical protein Dsin_009832 [Dipteronia sinensis]
MTKILLPPQDFFFHRRCNRERKERDGRRDVEEFGSKMKKILVAIADGLGSCPIQMVLEDGDHNFLKQVVDLELPRPSTLFQSTTPSFHFQ